MVQSQTVMLQSLTLHPWKLPLKQGLKPLKPFMKRQIVTLKLRTMWIQETQVDIIASSCAGHVPNLMRHGGKVGNDQALKRII